MTAFLKSLIATGEVRLSGLDNVVVTVIYSKMMQTNLLKQISHDKIFYSVYAAQKTTLLTQTFPGIVLKRLLN